MSEIRVPERTEHRIEPAPEGATCAEHVGTWARDKCGHKAVRLIDGRPRCALHTPKSAREVQEVWYIMGQSATWNSEAREYEPAVNEVHVLKRSKALVHVLSTGATGHRSQIEIKTFESQFFQTPREAIQGAIRKAGRESDRLRAALVKSQEHESRLIGMLAALPDDDTAAIAATNPPKGDGGERE